MSHLVQKSAKTAGFALFALLFINASTWAGDKVFMETSTARWGADYSVFSSESAKLCQQRCAQEGTCMAWTYVIATKKDTNGECHLKNMAPHARPNPCCTSGVLIGQSAPKGDPNRSPMIEASAIELIPAPAPEFVAETLPAQEVGKVDEAIIPVLDEATEVIETEDEDLQAEAQVVPAAVDGPISITPVSFHVQ